MNTGLWLSRPGDGEGEYGPVSLVELRTMVEAGLIAEDTRVRDADTAPRAIAGWDELLTALNTPAIREWRPATAHRGLVNASGELRTGSVVFHRVNTPGAAPAPEALGVLALNRACEPERIIVMPPWHRWPFWRNLLRFAALVVPVTGFSAWYWHRNGVTFIDSPFVAVQLVAFNVLLHTGWGFVVFVVTPKHWNN